MSKCEYWLHGSCVHVEYPDRLKHIRCAGYYTEVHQKGGTANWFNFGIPTPTLRNDKPMKHSRVHLLAEVLENAKLDKVHIWDGDRCVRKIDNLGLKRQHVDREFDVPPQKVRHGLMISVYVEFLDGEEEGEVHFIGAGATFEEA